MSWNTYWHMFSATATLLCAGVLTSIITSISTGVSTCAATRTGTPERASVHAVDDSGLLGEYTLDV